MNEIGGIVFHSGSPVLKRSKADSRMLPCGRPLPTGCVGIKDLKHFLKELNEKLAAFVSKGNLRKSEAREKILETIVYEVRHFRIQDLLITVRRRYPDIGQSTIYRTLPILVESGILQEGPVDPEGNVFYELLDLQHHDHIVCLDCQSIFEFHDDLIEGRQEVVARELGFSQKSHRHVIFGTCEYLSKK